MSLYCGNHDRFSRPTTAARSGPGPSDTPRTRVFLVLYDTPEEESVPATPLPFEQLCREAPADAVESHESETQDRTLPPETTAIEEVAPSAASPSRPAASTPCPTPSVPADLPSIAQHHVEAVKPCGTKSKKLSHKTAKVRKHSEPEDSHEPQTPSPPEAAAPSQRMRVRRNLAWSGDNGADEAAS